MNLNDLKIKYPFINRWDPCSLERLRNECRRYSPGIGVMKLIEDITDYLEDTTHG